MPHTGFPSLVHAFGTNHQHDAVPTRAPSPYQHQDAFQEPDGDQPPQTTTTTAYGGTSPLAPRWRMLNALPKDDGWAKQAGYANVGRADSVHHPQLRNGHRQQPGKGAFGAPKYQDLSSEEIMAQKQQLPDLMARSSTDPNALSQLLRLYKNTAMQPAYSHKSVERQETIQRNAVPTTHRAQAAKDVRDDTVTRQQAQQAYPHLDLRGVFAVMKSPHTLFFKIDFYNDAPYLTTSQLYQPPAVVQRAERFLFWWDQYYLSQIIQYLTRSICRSFCLSPMYLLELYNMHIHPKLIDVQGALRNEQFQRGDVPIDKYVQALRLASEEIQFPLTNRPVMNIVDAGVLPFTLLRLIIVRRAEIENEYTEWERFLYDSDPQLVFYSGPTMDADRIEREMANMYTRYRQQHMETHDRAFAHGRTHGGRQIYANLVGDDNELVWSKQLPRRGMSTVRPGYSSQFAAHQLHPAPQQDLEDIYGLMRSA